MENKFHALNISEYLKKQRWFLRKSSEIAKITRKELWKNNGFVSSFFQVRYKDRKTETYFFPLLEQNGKELEASGDLRYHQKLFSNLNASRKIQSQNGTVFFKCFKKLSQPEKISIFAGELSNTVAFIQDKYVVKIFRKQTEGVNPELEILSKLKKNVPETLGYVLFKGKSGGQYVIALIEKYVPNISDAWNNVKKVGIPGFSSDAGRLGSVIADMHCELDSAFGSEKFRKEEREIWFRRFSDNLDRLLSISNADIKKFLSDNRAGILNRAGEIFEIKDFGKKIRIHGDLHLGQILKTKKGFCVIDFQGEPLKSYEQVRQKQSPLKDVAGMLRSFDYAASLKIEDSIHLKAIFLSKYFLRLEHNRADFLPCDTVSRNSIISLFELEKTIYELEYEMNARPGWVYIPMQAIKKFITGS